MKAPVNKAGAFRLPAPENPGRGGALVHLRAKHKAPCGHGGPRLLAHLAGQGSDVLFRLIQRWLPTAMATEAPMVSRSQL
jgi:hypothetical protein